MRTSHSDGRTLLSFLFASFLLFSSATVWAADSGTTGCSKSLSRKYLTALTKLGAASVTRELANAYLNIEPSLADDRLNALASAKTAALSRVNDVPTASQATLTKALTQYFDNLRTKVSALNKNRLTKLQTAYKRADTKYQPILNGMADYSACSAH